MALVNYSVPYGSASPPFMQAAPPPQIPTYLGPEFRGYGAAAAINSLIYNTPQSVPTPNRKQVTRNRTVKRPIAPAQQQQQADRTDPYHHYNHYNRPVEEPRVSPQYLPVPEEPQQTQPQQQQQQQQQQHQQRRVDSRKKPLPPPQPEEVDDGNWPNRPPGYTRISNTFNSAPEPGSKTSIHAVIDFDDDFDDYNYEDDDIEPVASGQQKSPKPQVTPIEGPIFIKNGSVPVVPLYSYPTVNNGSLVQIPILWTALSVALGLEIRGEVIRGVPCIKRFHQLFCPTAGNSYPIDRIERFIDDNKALMKRMYGEFQMSTEYGPPAREMYERRRSKRDDKANDKNSDGPRPEDDEDTMGESYFAKHRKSRQSLRNTNQNSETGRVDACESKVEIVTPYWASNSAGKVRAIVNTQHFEQAIHQEVCSKGQTKRCLGDCGCEQKYKWHRLLAYDPDNDCKGIFMDWFLFPSCCVCRCAPLNANSSN